VDTLARLRLRGMYLGYAVASSNRRPLSRRLLRCMLRLGQLLHFGGRVEHPRIVWHDDPNSPW
jgi:hypothetical protein